MTFVTRYTPAPGEQALLKHIDGAGKVDGSCVVALPIDRWSAPYEVNSFEGHGGGLTFWDGREAVPTVPQEEEAKETTTPQVVKTDATTTSSDIDTNPSVNKKNNKNNDNDAMETKNASTTTTSSSSSRQLSSISRRRPRFRPREIHYETRSGDIAFIDRAVWHQADPITKGTRWALVIFYKVTDDDDGDGDGDGDDNDDNETGKKKE